MIFHIVLFQLKSGLAPDERRALLDALAAAVTAISTVRRCRIGRRIIHGAGYEAGMPQDLRYAAVIEFDDVAGLKAYLQHPAHDLVSERFRSLWEAGVIYDYEMMTTEEALAEGLKLVNSPT